MNPASLSVANRWWETRLLKIGFNGEEQRPDNRSLYSRSRPNAGSGVGAALRAVRFIALFARTLKFTGAALSKVGPDSSESRPYLHGRPNDVAATSTHKREVTFLFRRAGSAILSALASLGLHAAELPASAPLGPPPGVVIDASPNPAQLYVGTPAIAILPDGTYVAAHDFFGQGPDVDTTEVFGSSDRGATWNRLSEVRGQAWFSLFTHRGALYLLGTASRYGNLTIRRSTDGGRTWTNPTDAHSGLLLQGRYHGAPVPVVVHHGRIWRGVEERINDETWPLHFATLTVSAPENADLLEAKNWTRTNAVHFEPKWYNGQRPGWLEGNVVVTPENRLVNILRLHTEPKLTDPFASEGGAAGIPRYEVAVRCDISADGRTESFDPAHGFFHFPGSESKFTIRFDPVSKRYWALVNKITARHEGRDWKSSPIHQRNVLMLTSSADLREWREESIILRWREGRRLTNEDKVAFQYVDWQFDGPDLVAVSRTSWGGQNYHNANLMTFHRVKNFRTLKMSYSPPDLSR